MVKKKEPDKLALDMIECKKAGFGCHYGKWKALQPVVEVEKVMPDNFRSCEYCGQWYKPTSKRAQKYCGAACQIAAQRARDRDKHAQYQREWRERNAAR